jgi:hypothetical protein
VVGESVSDSELGRVDVLFRLLSELNILTPGDLDGYLATSHSDLEARPLADQVIDALLQEDPSRYEKYGHLRDEAQNRTYREEFENKFGSFLVAWAELEQAFRVVVGEKYRRTSSLAAMLRDFNWRDSGMRAEVDSLRVLRNMVVHGTEVPDAEYLADATRRIEKISEWLRDRDAT